MKKLMVIFALVAAFGAAGCAHQVKLRVNEGSELFKIKKFKGVPETHPGTVLFVNRSTGIWQRCLVFEDYLSKDQLLDPDYATGGFELSHKPVGYFEVGPAVDGLPITEKTKLVGFFFPGTDYTILCFLEGFDGSVLDIQTVNINFTPRPPGERFYYTTILGTPAEKFVNHYAYLPQWYSYRGSNTFGLTINLSDLLHRLIHSLTGRDKGLEMEKDDDDSGVPPSRLRPKFPALPDTTK